MVKHNTATITAPLSTVSNQPVVTFYNVAGTISMNQYLIYDASFSYKTLSVGQSGPLWYAVKQYFVYDFQAPVLYDMYVLDT